MKTYVMALFTIVTLISSPAKITAQDEVQGKNEALKTIGMQGASLLYNTYCLVGAINDGYVVDAWEKSFALDVLLEQKDLMVTISKQYDSLLASRYLSPEDSLYVLDMKEGCRLVKIEAECLIDYINSESEESRLRYADARNAAWKKIAEILGLNVQASLGEMQRKAVTGTK